MVKRFGFESIYYIVYKKLYNIQYVYICSFISLIVLLDLYVCALQGVQFFCWAPRSPICTSTANLRSCSRQWNNDLFYLQKAHHLKHNCFQVLQCYKRYSVYVIMIFVGITIIVVVILIIILLLISFLVLHICKYDVAYVDGIDNQT